MHVAEMLNTNPNAPVVPSARLVECIEACFDCAQSCIACVDACLGEQHINSLRRCIRLNLDCADICSTTGRMLTRQQHADLAVFRTQLEACALACRVCGDECVRYGEMHEHCRICAEACRACVKICQDV